MSTKLNWEDRTLSELIRLSWPITVSVVSYAIMTLVDTLFVGRLGPAALAGVGLAGTACFATLGFGLGMLRATKVVVSQEFGAKRDHTIGSHINSSLVLSMALSFAIVVIAWLVAPGLEVLNQSAEAAGYARQYFLTRMLSAPALLAYGTLREARFGVGDSRTPMVATVSGNLVNIVLDYLFIVEFGWGVPGAAYATNAGHVVEAVVLLWVHFRGAYRRGPVQLRLMTPLLRLGFPLGTQFVLEIGAFTMLAAMISRISDLQMAAHQIAVQVLHLGFLPAYAVGESASVLIGQAVGAHQDRLVKPVAHLALRVIAAYTALAGVVMGLLGAPIATAFTQDAGVIAATGALLIVGGVFQVGDGANILARSVLRGTGDVRWSAIVSVCVAWGFTPPLMWLFGYRLGLGALGGWIGLLLEIFVGAAILWWRVERNGWASAAAESRARQEQFAATDRRDWVEQPA
ncbi:MAG: MATE family efflux transporter [Myxococcota bacterium]